MSIYYKPIPRKNPVDRSVKYYPVPVRLGEVTLDQLAEEMADESTVTRHDVKAVLSSLQQHIIRHLQSGRSVRLGDLGSFHVTFTSKGQAQAADVTASCVRSVRVQFRKGRVMTSEFALTNKNMSLKNAASIPSGT